MQTTGITISLIYITFITADSLSSYFRIIICALENIKYSQHEVCFYAPAPVFPAKPGCGPAGPRPHSLFVAQNSLALPLLRFLPPAARPRRGRKKFPLRRACFCSLCYALSCLRQAQGCAKLNFRCTELACALSATVSHAIGPPMPQPHSIFVALGLLVLSLLRFPTP